MCSGTDPTTLPLATKCIFLLCLQCPLNEETKGGGGMAVQNVHCAAQPNICINWKIRQKTAFIWINIHAGGAWHRAQHHTERSFDSATECSRLLLNCIWWKLMYIAATIANSFSFYDWERSNCVCRCSCCYYNIIIFNFKSLISIEMHLSIFVLVIRCRCFNFIGISNSRASI